MRCLHCSLLRSPKWILAWDDGEIFWKCCLLFVLTNMEPWKIKISTNPSLEYAQSTTAAIHQTMNLHEQEPKQSNSRWKQSTFTHPRNESTTAASKQCNYVHSSFVWILSLPPFWLVYLSCFPSQVALLNVQYLFAPVETRRWRLQASVAFSCQNTSAVRG